MIMKANKQIGFIYKNDESIDRILKDGEVVFERGFLREKTSTTLPINFGGVGKDLKDYKIYGNTKQQLLPVGYTQVDYIESSGTQYINTGLKSTPNTKFDFEFTSTKAVGAEYEQVLGSQTGATNNRIYILIGGSNNIQLQFPHDSNNHLYMNNDGTFTSSSSSTNLLLIEQNKKNRIIFDIPNRALTVNEYTSVSTGTYDLTSSDYNILLFNRNDTVVPTVRLAKGKLYNFKWYESNVLVREFIPCYRNSDNEVGLYDLVNNVFYTNQGTGVFTYGSVAPTPDAPIDMVSCGDRTKNLIGFEDLTETTSNGVTYSIKDNVFTLNGTASGNIRYLMTDNWILKNAGNHTLKIDVISGTWTAGIIGLSLRKADLGQETYHQVAYNTLNLTITKEYTEENINNTVRIGFFINSGSVFNNFKFRIIFNEGSTATLYEPYGYKIPVNVRSDNLFNMNYVDAYIGDNNGLTYRNYNTTAKTGFIKCKPNTTYKIKKHESSNRFHICDYPQIAVNGSVLNRLYLNNDSSECTVTTNSDAQYLYIYVSTGSEAKTPLMTVVEGSTTPTKYQPYYNETTNIYLDEPLRKIDGYSDYIDFINGKVVRNISEVVLNGSETWSINSVQGNIKTQRFRVIGEKTHVVNMGYSNNFRVKDDSISVYEDTELLQVSSSQSNKYIGVQINIDRLASNTVADFVVWLSSNPVTLDYVLLTPTEESITLPNIPTVDGNNTLNIETELTPSQVYIKYKSNE